MALLLLSKYQRLHYQLVRPGRCNGRAAQWERARYTSAESELVGWGQGGSNSQAAGSNTTYKQDI